MRYFAFRRCRSRQFRKIFLFWIFSSLWAHFQILLNTCRVKTASDNSIDIHVLCHFCCALLSSNVSRWFHGMSEEEIWLIHLLCPIQLWSVIVVVVAFGYSQQFQFQNACECAILIRLLTFLTLCYLLSVFFQLKENGLSFYCSWWIPMTMWLKANFWSYFVFMFDIMFLLLLSLPGTVHTQSQSGRVGKKPNDYSFFFSYSFVFQYSQWILWHSATCRVEFSQKWPFVIRKPSGFFGEKKIAIYFYMI